MMKIQDFRQRIDERILRTWMHRLAASPLEMNPTRLHREVEKANSRDKFISRKALADFWHAKDAHKANKFSAYEMAWNYLRSNESYVKYFPEELYAPAHPSPQEPLDVLSQVLEDFFKDGKVKHDYPVSEFGDMLQGKYVMYRPDLRDDLLNRDAPRRVRATLVNIRRTDFGLWITEKQDFEPRPDQEEHHQENYGVISPYGKFLIAIMACKNIASFKCLVFTGLITNHDFTSKDSVKFNELKGEILVASAIGSYPSVKFFCRRFSAENPPHHGLISYDALDKAVILHIESSHPKNLRSILHDR